MGVGWNWFGNGMKMEIDKKFIIEFKRNGIEMKLKAEGDFTQKKTKQKYRENWSLD